MAVAVKPAVFRDVTPCSMVENAAVSVDGDGEDADGEQLDPFNCDYSITRLHGVTSRLLHIRTLMKSADRCNLVLNVRAQELTVAQLVKIISNMLLNLSIPVRVVLRWCS